MRVVALLNLVGPAATHCEAGGLVGWEPARTSSCNLSSHCEFCCTAVYSSFGMLTGSAGASELEENAALLSATERVLPESRSGANLGPREKGKGQINPAK